MLGGWWLLGEGLECGLRFPILSVMGKSEFSEMYTGIEGWSLQVALTRVEAEEPLHGGRLSK